MTAGIIKVLSIESGLPESTVLRIMVTAPNRYKEYTIPKRNGGRRLIAQPAREVKLLQRAFISTVLSRLPVHEAATAYIPGSSILHNAKTHAGINCLLKMDFKDFFPSIQKKDWVNYCKNTELFLDASDIELTASLMFRRPKGSRLRQLAIGAPSSPILSNILMFDFDEIVSNAAKNEKVTYTRYADDLTFSASRTGHLINIENIVRDAIKAIDCPSELAINKQKTTRITTKYSRSVTGLILANDGRVTIGKDKKRAIHAAVHSACSGKLNKEQMQQLAGLLAYVKAVEPDFLAKLALRYGENIIVRIKSSGASKKRAG